MPRETPSQPDQALAAIYEGAASTSLQIAAALGISRRDANRLLRRLKDEGWIRRVGHLPNGANPVHLYEAAR